MNRSISEPTTFTSSRQLEFCSEKELTNQVGHPKDDWLLVIFKELMDNALDACEEGGIAPESKVVFDSSGITVSDNGPGIPADTIRRTVDFTVRVSSREAYVGPTRGAQGLGLKTILPMPYIVGGGHGRVDVTAQGERHEITFSVDRIRQEPVVNIETLPAPEPGSGTSVKVYWPDSASSILQAATGRFLQLASDYTLLNPHLTLTIDVDGQRTVIKATNPTWKKWGPGEPTSAHWYTSDQFERLIGAYIAHDREHGTERSVREFVKEFKGLTGTAKQKAVLAATGLDRTRLSELAEGVDFRHDLTQKLLAAMKDASTRVKPSALGVIGKEHLRERFSRHCKMGSFRYMKKTDMNESGIPVVVETAFACLDEEDGDADTFTSHMAQSNGRRRLIAGVNWSPGIGNPFRHLGGGHGDTLDSLFEQQRVGQNQPVMLVVHCACPRVQYLDRGKTSVSI